LFEAGLDLCHLLSLYLQVLLHALHLLLVLLDLLDGLVFNVDFLHPLFCVFFFMLNQIRICVLDGMLLSLFDDFAVSVVQEKEVVALDRIELGRIDLLLLDRPVVSQEPSILTLWPDYLIRGLHSLFILLSSSPLLRLTCDLS
jgi:hypothetical protein